MKTYKIIISLATLCCMQAAQAGVIATSAWTGDADSGIDSSLTYTAAYNFGDIAEDTTINGVPFTGITASPNVPGVFSYDMPNATPDLSRNINAPGEGSTTMAVRMLFNNANATLSLAGLTDGQAYRTTLFTVGWDPAGTKREATITIAGDGTSQVVDVNEFGENNGMKVEIDFVASGTTQDITIDALVGSDTFHTYGVANAAIPEPATLGLIAVFGGGVLFIRRRFMM